MPVEAVALKVLKKSRFVEQFFEAERAAFRALQTSVDEVDSTAHIVQLLVEPANILGEHIFIFPLASTSLDYFLSHDRWDSPSLLWSQLAGLAKALSVLHGAGIVHTDINPENILVYINQSQSICLKLSDFGHSVPMAIDSQVVMKFAELQLYRTIGTYLAPEARSEKSMSLWPLDIWALGCVFSEIASYIQGGTATVDLFRSLRTTYTQSVLSDMFHDTRDLKGEIRDWLLNLGSSTYQFKKATEQILLMLSTNPDERPTAKANAGLWDAVYSAGLPSHALPDGEVIEALAKFLSYQIFSRAGAVEEGPAPQFQSSLKSLVL